MTIGVKKIQAAFLALVCLFIFLPVKTFAQIDIENAWFTNGLPGGHHIVFDIEIDSKFPDTLYVATIPGTIFRSLNRGGTWAELANASTTISEGVFVLEIDPGNPQTIYAGSLSKGVFKSLNFGQTWVTTGLTGTRITSLRVDPTDPNRVYAGTPENLMRSTNGGVSWTKILLDTVNVNLSSLALNPVMPDTIYAGTDGNGIYRSFDGGVTWKQVNIGLTFLRVQELVVHPTNPDTLYSATFGGGVFRSVNGADSWEGVNKNLSDLDVSSLAIAPSNPSTIFIGTKNGKIFKSVTNGNNWVDLTKNLAEPSLVGDIAVHPDSSSVIYAGLSAVQRLKQTGLETIASLAAGSDLSSLAAADLDGDGDMDLIAGNGGDNTLSIFLNSNLGAVFKRTNYRTGSGPTRVKTVDLDGDGDIDVVSANRKKRTLSVLSNDGKGVFGLPNELFVGGPVEVLALSDLDSDGDTDIVTANGSSGKIFFFLNDGVGSFDAPLNLAGPVEPSDIVVEDFSGDGIPDLALLSRSEGNLVLWENRGDVIFVKKSVIPVGLRPAHLVAADFDLDGNLDLAVSGAEAQVSLFFNPNGINSVPPVKYPLPDTASALVVVDLDLDRYPDLLVPRSDGEIGALINDGGGVFSTTLSFGQISNPGTAIVADLNSDGQQDVVLAASVEKFLVMFANNVALSIKDPAPPLDPIAADTQGDLGDNIDLNWKRPRVDEETGRVAFYRIFRSKVKDGPFNEIVRLDTTFAYRDSTVFVYRSYVDSSAVLDQPYYYYLISESVKGTFSVPSDTVKAISRAQPFFDFLFSGNSPYHIFDTVNVTVQFNPVGHDVQGFSLFMDYDTLAVKLLDGDLKVEGLQPIGVDPVLALTGAQVLQNRIDPIRNGRIDFGLGFLPELEDASVHVGSLRFLGLRDTTTRLWVVHDTSSTRQTALTDRANGGVIRPYIKPPNSIVFKNFRVKGQVAFQGRSLGLDLPIRFDMTQTDAGGNPLPDSLIYRPPNDNDMNMKGVQMQLNLDGSFTLLQVSPGRYGLFAKTFHYLRGRISGDSLVVNKSLGVTTPITFKWVSMDSSLISSKLRGGDANDDNQVNLADFGILAKNFGSSGFDAGSGPWKADFNGDRVVNLADFALLQSNFGERGLGGAVLTRPALVSTRFTLHWDKTNLREGMVKVGGATKMTGFSADLFLPDSVHFSSSQIQPGTLLRRRNPLFFARRIFRNGEVVFRLAFVLKNQGEGISGDGDLLKLIFFEPVKNGVPRLGNLQVLDELGAVAFAAGSIGLVLSEENNLPLHPKLFQNLPNPFNPTTTIPFAVPMPSQVVLVVYTILGQEVRTLVREVLQPGYHRVEWNSKDDWGRPVSSGIYLYRLKIGEFIDVKKAILLK